MGQSSSAPRVAASNAEQEDRINEEMLVNNIADQSEVLRPAQLADQNLQDSSPQLVPDFELPQGQCQEQAPAKKFKHGTSAKSLKRRRKNSCGGRSLERQFDESPDQYQHDGKSPGREDDGHGNDKSKVHVQDLDSVSNDSGTSSQSQGSTARKLDQIEQKIRRSNLSKRERRLLQNRKSALKCRLKKQGQLERLEVQVERMAADNRQLKERVSSININFGHKSKIELSVSSI